MYASAFEQLLRLDKVEDVDECVEVLDVLAEDGDGCQAGIGLLSSSHVCNQVNL